MMMMEDHHDPPPHLPAEIREGLTGRFDVDAAEELYASMSPEERRDFLEAVCTPPVDGETRDVSMPIWSSDPERQKVLDRLWAPMWKDGQPRPSLGGPPPATG